MFWSEPEYKRDGAGVIESEILRPGVDVPVFPDEPLCPYMEYEKWKSAFSHIQTPGLTFLDCSFSVGYYKYAIRGNNKRPALSRSQSVISHWEIEQVPDYLSSNIVNLGIKKLSLVFPVYDGIGFWVGEKRRKEGIINYTFEEEVAIAKASTIAAIRCVYDDFSKESNNAITYICLCAPGKIFNPISGKRLRNVFLTAGKELGLEGIEVKNDTRHRAEVSHFRVMGNIILNTEGEKSIIIPLDDEVGNLIKVMYPAWQKIRETSGDKYTPNVNNY